MQNNTLAKNISLGWAVIAITLMMWPGSEGLRTVLLRTFAIQLPLIEANREPNQGLSIKRERNEEGLTGKAAFCLGLQIPKVFHLRGPSAQERHQ